MSRLLPKPSLDGSGNSAAVQLKDTAPNQVALPTYILVPVKAIPPADLVRKTSAGAGYTSSTQSISTIYRQKRLPAYTEGNQKRTKSTSADSLQRVPVATGNCANAVSETCKPCAEPVDEPCLAHSLVIKDLPTVPKSLASLPAELYIARKDGMLDVGVFAKARIHHPSVFGPLVAPAKENTAPLRHRFALCEKNAANETVRVFDLDCDDLCNWMKFTREAVDRVQQNVVAFCENNSVYFATMEDILPDTELRFWYSMRYAKVLEDHGLLEKKFDEQENGSMLLCHTGDSADSLSGAENMPHESIDSAPRGSNVKTDRCQLKRSKGCKITQIPGKEIRKAVSAIRAKMRRRRLNANLSCRRGGDSFWMCYVDDCTMRFRDKIAREIHSLRHLNGPWNMAEDILCPVCGLQTFSWMDLVDHVEQDHLLGGQFRKSHSSLEGVHENIMEPEFFESVGLPRSESSDDDQNDILRLDLDAAVCTTQNPLNETPPTPVTETSLAKSRRINKESDVHTTEPESFVAAISRKTLQHRKYGMKPIPASKRRKVYTCPGGCKIKFQRKITLDIHRLRHQEESWDMSVPALCPECDFSAADWTSLFEHVENVHRTVDPPKPPKPPKPQKPPKSPKQVLFRCAAEKCRFAFACPELVDIHSRRHIQRDSGDAVVVDSSLRCPECDCSFSEYSTLLSHVESAHAVPRGKRRLQRMVKFRSKWFCCAECKTEFPTIELRDLHNLQHGIESKEHKRSKEASTCPAEACLFTCEQMDELIQHVNQRHSRREHYYCSRCNFPSKSMRRLEQHTQQAHIWSEAQKPFECEICHKKFTNRNNLRGHTRVHSKSSFFECGLCSTGFATKSELHGHFTESHSVDGNLTCSICGARFPSDGLAAFRRHLRRHVEAGQFECSICHKVFRLRTKLKIHIKAVHCATRDYKCECGKSFEGQHHLNAHRNRVHKEGKTDLRKRRSRKIAVKDGQSPKRGKTAAYIPPQKLKEYTEFPFYCEECRQGFCRRGMMAYHFTVRHPERSLDSVPQLALSSATVHFG